MTSFIAAGGSRRSASFIPANSRGLVRHRDCLRGNCLLASTALFNRLHWRVVTRRYGMMNRKPAEGEQTAALVAAERKADERIAASPLGMRATASELRRKAHEMKDRNDQDAMVRLAAHYEERADEA